MLTKPQFRVASSAHILGFINIIGISALLYVASSAHILGFINIIGISALLYVASSAHILGFINIIIAASASLRRRVSLATKTRQLPYEN